LLALDIGHGDKQSITIMTLLDTDTRVDSPVPQAVIRDALRRQKRRRRRVIGAVLLVLLSCGVLATVVGQGGGGKSAPLRGRESRPGSSLVIPLVPGSPKALSARQYLLTRASVEIAVGGLGSSGSVMIPAITQQWTNNEDTCFQVAMGAPDFTSAALRSEWTESGLSVTPLKAQPQGFCVENVPGGGALGNSRPPTPSQAGMLLAQGIGLIDLAGLSTDPSTLARDLEQGRTGNRAVDHAVANGTVASPGFERALLLLRSPKVGESTAFRSALLHALPLIHGVVRLGHQPTPFDKSAVGFAEGKGPDRPTVILDDRTGQLIEARNVTAGTLFRSVGMISFWNPYAPSTGGDGTGLITLTLVGFKPVGNQIVVGSSPSFGFPI
jgi:hypothetical protein